VNINPGQVDPAKVDLLRRPSFATDGQTAEAAEAAGLRDECFTLAEAIASAAPRDPAGWNLLGVVHRHFGDAEGAVRLWEHALTLDPRSSESIRQLGDTALEQGNPAEAERRYRQTLEIDPGALPVVGQLAEALLQQGEFAAAAELLEVFLKAHPRSAPAWCALGKTRAAEQETDAAKTAYEHALEIDGDSRDAHQGLGRALLALGDQDGAKVHLEAVARIQGAKVDRYRSGTAQDADAAAPRAWAAATHHDGAVLLARRGEMAAAEEAAKRAIELDADAGPSRALLAALLAKARRGDEALAVLRGWCDQAPSSAEAWISLGQMAFGQGRSAEAESALRKGIELAPDNAGALVLLARVVAPANVSEGLALAKRAVDAEPIAANYYALADMLVRSGARDEALAALEKAMALAPGERRYRQTYEQLKSQP
jgi:tetratricopeptide (TPR) repeat protein